MGLDSGLLARIMNLKDHRLPMSARPNWAGMACLLKVQDYTSV